MKRRAECCHIEGFKCILTLPDKDKQSDETPLDMETIPFKQHMLHVRTFKGANCDKTRYVVVANLGRDCQ